MARARLLAIVISLASLTVAPARAISDPGVFCNSGTQQEICVYDPAQDLSVEAPDTSSPPGASLTKPTMTATIRVGTPLLPAGVNSRVLVIGPGIQQNIFPTPALQSQIVAASGSAGLTDPHGYGTLVASVILQLSSTARVLSYPVTALDANWTQLNLSSLHQALSWATSNPASYDVAVLAIPPISALDPLPYMRDAVGYPSGSGLTLAENAMLDHPWPTEPPVVGIPADAALRSQVFGSADSFARDAVEKLSARAEQWSLLAETLQALSAAGVPVLAPAGDFGLRNASGERIPVYTQSIYGLAARPDVITVGAAQSTGVLATPWELSQASAIGPTLGLRLKPDLLAPADVMGLVPPLSVLGKGWGRRTGTSDALDWPDAQDTLCAGAQGNCVLYGSSVVALAVAATQAAALVAKGVPHLPTARTGTDDEVIRGLLKGQASRARAQTAEDESTVDDENREAFGFEQGAGVLTGFGASFSLADATARPVVIDRVEFGEVGFGKGGTTTIRFWPEGASPGSIAGSFDSFAGASPTGEAVVAPYPDPNPVAVSYDSQAGSATLTLAADVYQAGVFSGRLSFSAGTDSYAEPVGVVRDRDVTIHSSYLYSELQTKGFGDDLQGERVEDVTFVLMPGIPAKHRVLGSAFKFLQEHAHNPTEQMIRYAVTRAGVLPAPTPQDWGRATITNVPPGYWRYVVVANHEIVAEQDRLLPGTNRKAGEGLAPLISGSGPEVASVPGATLLVPSIQLCSQAATAKGPITKPGCFSYTTVPEHAPGDNGFCRVGQYPGTTYWLYCDEAPLPVPSSAVSRAVHLVQYEPTVPARNEWSMCAVEVPADGEPVAIADLVARASGPVCPPGTSATSWKVYQGAPDCLGPTEKALYPLGHPADLMAEFTPQPLLQANYTTKTLPILVLSYRFALPAPTNQVDLGLSFAYRLENAILSAYGAGLSTLVLGNDPRLQVDESLYSGTATGSVFKRWSWLSEASGGTVSFAFVPTSWVSETSTASALSRPVAVSLCNVGLRVKTFAKTGWGKAGTVSGVAGPAQTFTQYDNGLSAQIDATHSRIRARYNPGLQKFTDIDLAHPEAEDAMFAVQIHKNTTTDLSKPHHVRSEYGRPSYLADMRTNTGDSLTAVGESLHNFPAWDYQGGSQALACNPTGPTGPLCTAWIGAEDNEILSVRKRLSGTGFETDPYINGRFAGVVRANTAAIEASGGAIRWINALSDDGGAFESHWETSGGQYVKEVEISTFFGDDALDGLDSRGPTLTAGWISVTPVPGGSTVLKLETTLPARSGRHNVTAALDCITVDDGSVYCP